MLRGFFLHNPLTERGVMRGWFLFAIIVFLVFGVPLIDELYNLRVRRAAKRAQPIVRGPFSLVPDQDDQNLLRSDDIAPAARTKEYVAGSAVG